MLTISQLASYAGVTVRTVRHYHAKGLLPEPARDHSGYRRYGAGAVVDLIRIRTLAEAGVPLSRVRQLLGSDIREFAAAVEDIDRRLRADIRELQHHRKKINQLAAGDSLALPPEAVAYLDRMRELGFADRVIQIERDSWILIAAQMPDEMPGFMTMKQATLENDTLRGMYLAMGELADCGPDDPRLPALADHVAAFLEAETAAAEAAYTDTADAATAPTTDGALSVSEDLTALLDTAFVESFPCAPRLLRLLEDRGWTGWTDVRRVERGPAPDGQGRLARDHPSRR